MNVNSSLVNKNILIVDDSNLVRQNLTISLKDSGFKNIIEAEDGLNAQEILENNNIDLVISDWEMPNLDGIELFESIINEWHLVKVKIV